MCAPLVSVIIPVYNAEKYLEKCLDSILCQTYRQLEVICINDGSTDSSLAILTKCSQKDERVLVINKENQGVSIARNVGLEQMKGDYAMFVDADDWLDIDCIEKVMTFRSEFHCDIVMFSYIRERAKASVKRDLFSNAIVFEGEECSELARRIIGPINEEITSPSSLDSYGTIWGKLYSSQLINGLRFVDLKEIGTAEDSLFNMFAFKQSDKIGYIPDVYYHYRRSVHSSLTGGYVPDLLIKWKSLFSIIDNNFRDEDEKQSLSNRIALGTLGLMINAYKSNQVMSEVRDVLGDDLIHQSLTALNKRNLPLHWKLFYSLAEFRFCRLIIFIISVIQKIREE